ncbi:anaerobic benzoate catabolism transcriptional regulator [Rubripirellula tenax]|uniref:Anaerobic benzoate catabolism transcriptional regulator n=1 Tax=Rubripirellula tenax TaxID=2528015 RepID=A0A5C6F0A4_9BACT|nr:anaerobic benzoate catabolism transcriptional regulator [Rubripirellula tenax]
MDAIELDFGKTVRKHREKSGLSQEEFAAKAGVHRTYISSIELGKVQVSIGVAEKLAQALGVPLSNMFREIERGRDDADG